MEKETKIISISTQKGGSGKSTATHMVALALTGIDYNKDVLVIDTDEQRNLKKAYDRLLDYNADNPEEAIKAYDFKFSYLDSLLPVLQEAQGKYDYIFIDLPGTYMVEGVKSALLYCDVVFVPIKHNQPDLDSSLDTFKILSEVSEMQKKAGHDFNFYIFISQAEPKLANFKLFKNILASMSYPVLENAFFKYAKFADALNNYENILDAKNWKTEESSFNNFFEEVYSKIKN